MCERNTDTPPNVITLERFLSGEDELQVLLYKRDSDEARADSLAMALMATEERVWKDVPYDILGNNCEHFTHFCRVGKKFSVQVCMYSAAVEDPYSVSTYRYGHFYIRHFPVLRKSGQRGMCCSPTRCSVPGDESEDSLDWLTCCSVFHLVKGVGACW